MANCKICERHMSWISGYAVPLRWTCRSCFDKYLDYKYEKLSKVQEEWREKLGIKQWETRKE